MFYCDPCAKKFAWRTTGFRSRGRCEICENLAECNDTPSSRLPIRTPMQMAAIATGWDVWQDRMSGMWRGVRNNAAADTDVTPFCSSEADAWTAIFDAIVSECTA